MSKYHCEGLIKTVKVEKDGDDEKVMFTIEPSSTYLFERKKDDGTMERRLLFVKSDADTKNGQSGTLNEQIKELNAKIIASSSEFKAPIPCWVNTLLIAKANRMRVRIEIAWKTRQTKNVEVASFTVI